MTIKNLTKNTIISKSFELCTNIYSKSIGLMFSRKSSKALIFNFDKERIISLHMFFVFHPIDVLFLNKKKIVVDKKENFKPFTIYSSKKKAMYAIELPNGIINKTKTEIGDKIIFKK